MESALRDRLVSSARTRAERALLARAIARLDERHDLERKTAREPELAAIIEEFIGRPGALDFLADASFEGVQDSRLFGSPEFRKAYPRRRDHQRVKAEIARQERRVLKPDGVLIHSDIR